MLIKVLQRMLEVFVTVGLVFFSFLAELLLEWMIEDDFFCSGSPPSAYFVHAQWGNFLFAILLILLFAFITWRMLSGRSRLSWRFIAALYLAEKLLVHILYVGLPVLFRMPGLFAWLGKICYVIVVLYPAVWLFLPRREYRPQVDLTQPDPSIHLHKHSL